MHMVVGTQSNCFQIEEQSIEERILVTHIPLDACVRRPQYMAPEIVVTGDDADGCSVGDRIHYTKAVDVYGTFGCAMTGDCPSRVFIFYWGGCG